MRSASASQLAWFLLPLAVLAFAAGALRAAAQRQADPRRRRAYQLTWILLLFLGTPLWLFVGVTLRLF